MDWGRTRTCDVVVGRAIGLPNHVRPRKVVRFCQAYASIGRADPLQGSADGWIVLERKINRLFKRKHLLALPDCARTGGPD